MDPERTKLAYFDDMFELQASGKITGVATEGGRTTVILDRTIFYPQGGGQPADTGSISSADGEIKFLVEDVRSKNGIVYHYGAFEPSSSVFSSGQEVLLLVDPERRELHSRLHTAGHLLDVCMTNVGLSSLKPGKSNHSSDGSFVEYIGAIPANELETKRLALQAEIKRLIAASDPVQTIILPYEDAAVLCGGDLPDYISKESTPRIVKIGNYPGCPCGGTHVKNVGSIGDMTVTKIRVKKGVTKVSYNL